MKRIRDDISVTRYDHDVIKRYAISILASHMLYKLSVYRCTFNNCMHVYILNTLHGLLRIIVIK